MESAENIIANLNNIWTLAIAAYAAIISTFVLGWDVYRYLTSGARIKLSVTMNKNFWGGVDKNEENYIFSIAQNIGGRPTTITNLGGRYYSSWWKAYLRPKNLM